MKIKVTNIVYDTDDGWAQDGLGISVEELQLPNEMIVEVDGIIDIEDEIASVISDTTGWCVSGYNYEIL